jgi:molybdate transport system regulatory protein
LLIESDMKLGYKIWIDSEGKAFGEGPHRLLSLVEKTGSLHRAATEMHMSYRKAWLLVKAMEERLGFPLLERRVGGSAGGGSSLTGGARTLMSRYDAFHREAEETLEKLYRKHFGS